MSNKKVSVSEYARLRQVSHTAVQLAIKHGRLKNAVTKDEKGKVFIDPLIANNEWKRNTDPTKVLNKKGKNNESNNDDYDRLENQTLEMRRNNAPSIAESRAIKEAYLARLSKLEYEEKVKKLVNAEDVKNEAFKLARSIRDNLIGIPDRIAAELVGVKTAEEVHSKISNEIRKVLDLLAF
jgi:phage terminase Nu1 subunit (DNA packaging protein)